MIELTYGSLFAGIGGMDLGFERAGMVCKWQVEIDDFCQKVLTKHWPDVPKYKDVRDVGKENLQPVDVIIGGFPCQPHSVAGKQRGAADDRNLWPEYRRIVAELRPTWVVGENVPGLEHTMLDTVLSDLESEGYEVVTLNIPAVALDAPHRRGRLFIVANTGSERLETFRDSGGVPQKTEKGTPTSIKRGSCASDTDCYFPVTSRFGEWWPVEPDVGRSFDGIPAGLDRPQLTFWSGNWERNIPRVAARVPNRVDRLKSLGNAVVPQVAEFVARMIVEVENGEVKP